MLFPNNYKLLLFYYDIRFYDVYTKKHYIKNYSILRNLNQYLLSEYIDVNVLGEVLESTDLRYYLFPDDEIVAVLVPCRAIKSNASLIFSKLTNVVLTSPQKTSLLVGSHQ